MPPTQLDLTPPPHMVVKVILVHYASHRLAMIFSSYMQYIYMSNLMYMYVYQTVVYI